MYNSETISGTTLTLSGYTPSFTALGRYLQEMYLEPDITGCTLTSTIPDSAEPNPNVATPVALPAGIAGQLPGFSQPVTSYTVYEGNIVSVNGAAATTPTAPTGTFDLRRDGFPFSVELDLKQGFTPPQPPGSGAPGGP